MLTRTLAIAALAVFAITSPVSAEDQHATLNDAVFLYAAIGNSLSQDSVSGVSENAHGLLKILEEHHGTMHGDHAMSDEANKMLEEMEKSLELLAADDMGLGAARAAYKSFSAQFIPMAQMAYEKGAEDPSYSVMNCSMAKAQWIQIDGKVANPFYGSKMLRCGNKVSDLVAASEEEETMGEDSAHSHHGGGGH